MHKKVIHVVLYLALLSIITTGCGKKAESKPATPAPAARPVKHAVKAVEKAAPKRPAPSTAPITEERVLFSFENSLGGWEIPDWALEKDDHVARAIEISEDFASEGKKSMKVDVEFTGGRWMSSVLELEQYLDFSPYRQIAVDVYVPKDVPLGLRAKFVLTVGENWKFTEMNRAVPLVSGEWVTIKGNIEPGSYDWKRTVPDENFRADVRKIVVRVESNKRPAYTGPIYIDNIRIGK